MTRFLHPAEPGLIHCEVEEGYLRWAPHYDAMLTDTCDGPILRRFIEHGVLAGRDHLLDYGCDTGR